MDLKLLVLKLFEILACPESHTHNPRTVHQSTLNTLQISPVGYGHCSIALEGF